MKMRTLLLTAALLLMGMWVNWALLGIYGRGSDDGSVTSFIIAFPGCLYLRLAQHLGWRPCTGLAAGMAMAFHGAAAATIGVLAVRVMRPSWLGRERPSSAGRSHTASLDVDGSTETTKCGRVPIAAVVAVLIAAIGLVVILAKRAGPVGSDVSPSAGADRAAQARKLEPPSRFKVYTAWPFDAAEAKRRQLETARALGVEVEREIGLGPGVKLTLVLMPAGELTVGSPCTEAKRFRNEDQKQVTVSEPFWMSSHEVTQEQWQAVMGGNPSHFKGEKNPVEQVSWHAIQKFLRKANARVGAVTLALPTEAQWEYACRAGTATPFHFGATISADQANYKGDYTYGNGRKGLDRQRTMPVGSFPANAWGIHDMHGNVWEWCASPYSEVYDGSEQKGADARSRRRVLRGGSWFCYPLYCRSACRGSGPATCGNENIGFRVSSRCPGAVLAQVGIGGDRCQARYDWPHNALRHSDLWTGVAERSGLCRLARRR